MKYELKSFEPNQDFTISVEKNDLSSETISFSYEITGEVNNILWASEVNSPKQKDELWTSTCIELFVAQANGKKYMEWNVSPTHDWANYKFNLYRERDNQSEVVIKPTISKTIMSEKTINIEFILQVGELALFLGDKPWEFYPSVILKLKDESFSYWAIQHLSDEPDFHKFK